MKRLLEAMLVLVACLALVPLAAIAEGHGRDGDHDRDDRGAWRHRDRDHDRDAWRHRDWDRNRWRDRDRDRDRFRRHFRDDDRDDPPGWSRGRKRGWNGGDEPPGLARKHHRRHYHYPVANQPVASPNNTTRRPAPFWDRNKNTQNNTTHRTPPFWERNRTAQNDKPTPRRKADSD